MIDSAPRRERAVEDVDGGPCLAMDDVEEEATLDKVKQTAERIAKGEGYSAAA